jgi:LCP family protein required for cell wall assembly
MRNKRNKYDNKSGNATQIIITIALCAVLITLILQLGFNYIPARRNDAVQTSVENVSSEEEPATDAEQAADTHEMGSGEKWQEGDISHDGKTYRYNSNLKNILIMGVDRSGVVTPSEDYVSGGQSDAMFLLVVDNDNRKISWVAINRNTVADVDVYNPDGTYEDTLKYQICLQHAYGDGKRLSCDRTVDAVSKLFYNLPISGYMAMNMDGITVLNDALGGVTVKVLKNLSGYGVSLKKGETVTLKGDAAVLYLRQRDTGEFDSASLRLERQQQYLEALTSKLNTAAKSDDEEEQQLLLDAYSAVNDYIVSSVDFSSLVSELADYSFDESDMYSIPGSTQQDTDWEAYNVDEEEFYDLILDVFYEEVQ